MSVRCRPPRCIPTTVPFWVLVMATTWGVLAVRSGREVNGFVPAMVLLVGAIAGVPTMASADGSTPGHGRSQPR